MIFWIKLIFCTNVIIFSFAINELYIFSSETLKENKIHKLSYDIHIYYIMMLEIKYFIFKSTNFSALASVVICRKLTKCSLFRAHDDPKSMFKFKNYIIQEYCKHQRPILNFKILGRWNASIIIILPTLKSSDDVFLYIVFIKLLTYLKRSVSFWVGKKKVVYINYSHLFCNGKKVICVG